jgi:hypothetical protein
MSRRLLIAIGAIVALVGIGRWPVTTRFGVNYEWSSRRSPLYEKAIHFVSRDLETRRLAKEIAGGSLSDEERILKVFVWVSDNIQPAPDGFPVIDDHVLNVLIRRYGRPDQRTEAFGLLAASVGFHASTVKLAPEGTTQGIMLSLIRSGSKTWVFDVVNRLIFRNDQGDLADFGELLEQPRLITQAAPGLIIEDRPYDQYLLGWEDPRAAFTRMDAQRTWPRLMQELGRMWHGVLGRELRGSVK